MRPHELDALLEQWARWIRADGYGGSSFGSMLEMMMITGCMFSGGGRGQALWTVEADVEAAVMALAAADRNAATVIRIEYRAWDLGGLDKKARQIDKAHALFMSLSTYKRRLAKGRGFIAAWLSKQRGNDGKAPHC